MADDTEPNIAEPELVEDEAEFEFEDEEELGELAVEVGLPKSRAARRIKIPTVGNMTATAALRVGLDPTPAAIELDPETAAQVEELKVRVNRRHGNRRNAEAIAQEWVEQGNDLIAIKDKVGHGNWGQWIIDNLEFSQSTAENYMKIAKAIQSGQTKVPTIANMGLKAALFALKEHVDPIARQHKKLRGAFKTFQGKDRQERVIAEWDAIEQDIVKDSGLFEKQDWPEPNQVGETLLLEWYHERQETPRLPYRQVAYIWKFDINSFKIIVIQFGHGEYYATASRQLHFWKNVLPWLREFATRTGAGGKFTLMFRDPARIRMLQQWAETILLKRRDEPLI